MKINRGWLTLALCLGLNGAAFAGGEYVGERNSFNRFHGQGKYSYTNGAVYEGSWVDGRKQGQGMQKQPDGSVYTGQWRDNLQNGVGQMQWANGDRYNGEWSDGRMHGKGVLIRSNGERYEGHFAVNHREGKGVLTKRSGERFEGQWKADKRDGPGVLKQAEGVTIKASWSADRVTGDAQMTFANGDTYLGALLNGQPHGKGTCKVANITAVCEYKVGKRVVAEQKTAVAVKNKPLEPSTTANTAEPVKTVVADVAKNTAVTSHVSIEKINQAPAPAAGIAASTLALQTHAPQFSFLHDWDGANKKNNSLPVVFAEKDAISFGDVKIRAEGGDVSITLVVDEYNGPGVYPLKYFKASIAKEGVASYQTAAAEPGEIQVTYDDGETVKGTFKFVAYRNGNPATQEKRTVSEGLFVVPVRSAGK